MQTFQVASKHTHAIGFRAKHDESKSVGKSADVYHLTFSGRFGDVGTFDRVNMRARIFLSNLNKLEDIPHHRILINLKIQEICNIYRRLSQNKMDKIFEIIIACNKKANITYNKTIKVHFSFFRLF